MSFEQIYASRWHHPIAFWVIGAPVLALLVGRWLRLPPSAPPGRRLLARLLPAVQLGILADAWLTGPLSPVPAASALAGAVPIAFVILGDLRYFVLLERFRRPQAHPLRWLLVPALASLIVPIASWRLAEALWPGAPRVLFLTYELMFAVLAAAIAGMVLRRQPAGTYRTWLLRLTGFELVQYLGWACADAIILSGYDEGFLLRLLPNAMYYVAFAPFAYLTAPLEVRP